MIKAYFCSQLDTCKPDKMLHTRSPLPLILLAVTLFAAQTAAAQRTLSLDSCRNLALSNNHKLLAAEDHISAATYEHRAAKTNYLPKLSATAGYIYNARRTQLLSKDQRNTLNHLGDLAGSRLSQKAQELVQQFPDLAQLIGSLGTPSFPTLNALGKTITRAYSTYTHNLFGGGLVLTQPLYMGGRLKAYDKITDYTRLLLGSTRTELQQQTILETDQAYWQVVSLKHKQALAQSYLKMLQKIDSDIQKMYQQGVVNKASTLNVRVKLNEAQLALTKVDNGLSLSRMLLCEICGLPITDNIRLADEDDADIKTKPSSLAADTTTAFLNRPDLEALKLATDIADQNVKIVRSAYMPNIAAFGSYYLTNPNVYDGFRNKFGGNMSIGVALHVPIWNWGESKYRIRAAKAEADASRHNYQQAKDLINLQVNQARNQAEEAQKRLVIAQNNLAKANENLHYADVGFHEGVISTSDLLEAQTAWVEAQSQKIDAQVDVKITQATMLKAIGRIGN